MFVVPTNSSPIIGLETCERVNLIKRLEILDCDDANLLPSRDIWGNRMPSIIYKLKRMQFTLYTHHGVRRGLA